MCYLVLLSCVIAAAMTDDKYTDKYDNIDIQEILSNKRLLQAYIDCLMERGKCTPEGKELKGEEFEYFVVVHFNTRLWCIGYMTAICEGHRTGLCSGVDVFWLK